MRNALAEAALEWRDDINAQDWDRALAALGGHPLQSALWGDARRLTDGTSDQRWMALRNGEPRWLARIEQRSVPGGWVGWVPRGPTGEVPEASDLPDVLRDKLRRDGMILLVTDRWAAQEVSAASRNGASPRTIWIDLSRGLETLSKALDKQWRYGVGRARRLGNTIDAAESLEDTARFFRLCNSIAGQKGFALPGSIALLQKLLERSGGEVEARLLLARVEGVISAGAFVIRCGRSLHYIWGGTDRAWAQSRAGEAVQWAAIEWGVAQGCTRYDLEGIDPEGNPGTYAFKKKMGGVEVTLSGKRYFPTGAYGRMVAWLAARRG